MTSPMLHNSTSLIRPIQTGGPGSQRSDVSYVICTLYCWREMTPAQHARKGAPHKGRGVSLHLKPRSIPRCPHSHLKRHRRPITPAGPQDVSNHLSLHLWNARTPLPDHEKQAPPDHVSGRHDLLIKSRSTLYLKKRQVVVISSFSGRQARVRILGQWLWEKGRGGAGAHRKMCLMDWSISVCLSK